MFRLQMAGRDYVLLVGERYASQHGPRLSRYHSMRRVVILREFCSKGNVTQSEVPPCHLATRAGAGEGRRVPSRVGKPCRPGGFFPRHYADGVLGVPLDSLSSISQVPTAVAVRGKQFKFPFWSNKRTEGQAALMRNLRTGKLIISPPFSLFRF